MKLNSAVYGTPVKFTNGKETMYTCSNGGGQLSTLLSDGYISLNTKFDQSIIYTTTTANYFKKFLSVDNQLGRDIELQTFTGSSTVGVIMAELSPLNYNPAELYWNDYSSRDNPYLVYNATAYGMKQYGHNPYGAGNYTCGVRFITGYNWKNVRYAVTVVALNTIAANNQTSIASVNSNCITRVSLEDYLNNVNNIQSSHGVVIGAYITPYRYDTSSIETVNIHPVLYTEINTSTNTISSIKAVNNNIFFLNQSTVFTLGATYIQNTVSGGPPLWYGVDGTLFDVGLLQINGGKLFAHYPMLKGSARQLITAFAYLGLPIATNSKHAANDAITGGTIYAMNIDDTGKTDGNLVSGNDISNIRQSNFTDDILTDNGFNGIDNVDPNNYTDKIDLNKPTLSTTNIFNRTFALNANNVKSLADFLWNADETKFDEIIKGLGLMGENPIDGLIDLRMYPFDVAAKNSSTAAESIVVGRTDTGVNGIKITENANAIIDLGSCSFFQKFKNFLDYEPYTTAQLYIPYVGVVPVSTAEFMGHNISCKMIVDFVTGGCTAVVYKDDIPYIYRNGTMAVEVPMTATNSARMAQTALNNVIGAVMDTGKTIGALGSGDVGGTITGGISALSNVYSAASIPTQYQTAGASTANCATWQPQNCYFIIDRPITQIPDNYGHTVGYACEISGTLNSFSGFTVIANPDINFKCTDTEKTMLINALHGGVYV